MSCTLAIDQGTHASRAVVFDESGTEIAKSIVEVDLRRLDSACVEQSPEQILQSVNTAIGDVLAQAVGRRIAACGLATQRSTVLAWNHHGEALSAALSWQDVRAAAELLPLRVHRDEIQKISGLPLSPHYGASKMHWLAMQGEGQRAERFSPLASYLLFHLLDCQPYLVDHCNAQRTQLFDIMQLDWSEKLCNWFDVNRRALPGCMPVCHAYGEMVLAGIPITAVSGDQNAAFYGEGAPAEDIALVNMGSGAFILRGMQHYHPSPKQLTGIAMSSADEISWLREATVNGAGSALEWVAQHFYIEDMTVQLPSWLETVSIPPVFINTVGGLGSPWWNTRIAPRYIENTLDDASRMAGAAESILFMLNANLELMRTELAINRLRVSGGLSRLDAMCQKLANLSGLPVERLSEHEATARGIAWLAAGQPAHWRSHAAPDVFLPLHDVALHTRYHASMEQLHALLERKENMT